MTEEYRVILTLDDVDSLSHQSSRVMLQELLGDRHVVFERDRDEARHFGGTDVIVSLGVLQCLIAAAGVWLQAKANKRTSIHPAVDHNTRVIAALDEALIMIDLDITSEERALIVGQLIIEERCCLLLRGYRLTIERIGDVYLVQGSAEG